MSRKSTIFLLRDTKEENYQLMQDDFYENDYMNGIADYYNDLSEKEQDVEFERLCKEHGIIKLEDERHIQFNAIAWFKGRLDTMRNNFEDFKTAFENAEQVVASQTSETEIVETITEALDYKFRPLRLIINSTIDDYVYYNGVCYTMDSFILNHHNEKFYVCGSVLYAL